MRFTATGSYRNRTCFPEQLGLIIMPQRRIVNHKLFVENDCYFVAAVLSYSKYLKQLTVYGMGSALYWRANPSGTKPP